MLSAWKRHFCASAGVFEEIYQCVHRTKQIKKEAIVLLLRYSCFTVLYWFCCTTSRVYLYSLLSLPPSPRIPPILVIPESAEPELLALYSRFPLSVSHMGVYRCQASSPSSSHPLPPSVSTRLYSVSVSLFLPCR